MRGKNERVIRNPAASCSSVNSTHESNWLTKPCGGTADIINLIHAPGRAPIGGPQRSKLKRVSSVSGPPGAPNIAICTQTIDDLYLIVSFLRDKTNFSLGMNRDRDRSRPIALSHNLIDPLRADETTRRLVTSPWPSIISIKRPVSAIMRAASRSQESEFLVITP